MPDPFFIQIAESKFRVESLFSSTNDYCRNYWTDSESAHEICVSEEDLIREQAYLDQEAREERLKLRKFSGPFLDRAVVQRKVAEFLLDRNVLMLHGSTVCVDGYAYLFTAACGTGKSTHTRMWCEMFRDRAMMVNDDKPFLKIQSDLVLAYGSPWSGKHGLDSNISAPLKGICILRRGCKNAIRRMGRTEAVEMLRHQSFVPEGGEASVWVLVDRLMDLVPLWEMECTKDPEAALVAYGAMSK